MFDRLFGRPIAACDACRACCSPRTWLTMVQCAEHRVLNVNFTCKTAKNCKALTILVRQPYKATTKQPANCRALWKG